jgi:hypothetical protein
VLVGSGGEPGVEVVEDGFDGWPELVGDLVLALALAGAASGLGDDDLEDAGQYKTHGRGASPERRPMSARKKGALMTTTTHGASRTARLLALMKKATTRPTPATSPQWTRSTTLTLNQQDSSWLPGARKPVPFQAS